MGSGFLYPRLSWLGLYSATRWNPALPCKPPALSPGAPSRARWLPTDLVCCTYRSLPFLPFACAVSREQHHPETTTGECGVAATQHFSLESSPPSETASVLLASAPVLWRDWPRCGIRRTWLKVIRSQTICLESPPPLLPSRGPCATEKTLTRAERAHWRLSWEQHLARNARPADAPQLVVTLHGLPTTFASSFGFDFLATA